MLGFSRRLHWEATAKGLVIDVPDMSISEMPCRNAWRFKLTGLKAAGSPRFRAGPLQASVGA
jgi:hypothetical protein